MGGRGTLKHPIYERTLYFWNSLTNSYPKVVEGMFVDIFQLLSQLQSVVCHRSNMLEVFHITSSFGQTCKHKTLIADNWKINGQKVLKDVLGENGQQFTAYETFSFYEQVFWVFKNFRYVLFNKQKSKYTRASKNLIST